MAQIDPDKSRDAGADAALLQEIRDRYRYASSYWEEIRKERQKDLRFLCGNPWEDEDRKERADNGRPCINHDELNQYVNQGVNNLRQNKRGIKIEPRRYGATEKTAELHQDLARTIESNSNAQSAYLRAGQDMYEGSYGFFRISRRYVSNDIDGPDDQEIVIKTIPNPDAVLYDPDCKEPDWSDAVWCFIVEPISTDEFKRRYPDAQKTDFTSEDRRTAKDWLTDKQVLVAEYWKVEVTRVWNTRRTRQVDQKKVVQYITNGVEILETLPQLGEEIPIPAMIGMERYVDEGSGPKRKLFSLPRLARDPQMSLAYLCSLEMEDAGRTPKTPFIGYKGQFETDAEAWEHLNRVPRAYVQVDPIMDEATRTVLPLPQRQNFTPNFQQYELAKDGARRAIQAAMGTSPLPTAAQRDNQKSGVALERLEHSREVGSFHFVEGYDRAITRGGRVVESWIPKVYDTEREEALRRPDDSRRLVKLNTADPYQNDAGEPEHYQIGDEEHDVSVSAGPSQASQVEAAGDFLDLLVGNLGNLPIPPDQRARLLAMAIRMKQLGPKGDEMADIISPAKEQPLPPQAMQAVQGLQQKLQSLNAYAQQLEEQIQKLEQEKKARVVDNEYKMELEKLRIEADTARAEISTKAQSLEERMKFVEDLWRQLHSQAHKAGIQAADQAHQASMADQAAAAAQQQLPPAGAIDQAPPQAGAEQIQQ